MKVIREKIATGRIPYSKMGEKSINIGDLFCGYSCGFFWDNQTVIEVAKSGNILGTTTLATFNLRNIKKIEFMNGDIDPKQPSGETKERWH